MRTASTAFKQLLASGGNTFLNSVSIQLASNETLSIDNTKLMNLEFEDCVGSDNTFDALGSTIINSCKITIYNGDESFSEYDFEDAVATVYVGLQVGSSIESRQIGVFTVDNATNTPNAIILSMLDNMSKFDEPYSKSSLVYPATLAQIIADACTVCGVTYNSNESDSDLDSLSIDTKPDGEPTTFRDVIGWVATIKCTFARCNSLGQLELKWFDKTTADSSLPRITLLASQEIATSDIAVTGVKITIGSADTDADTSIIVGTNDYLISITNNPFITTSNLDTVKTTLSTKLIGLTFRKCNIVCLNNPLLEAGDAVRLTDTKGSFHRIIITRTTFSPIINQTVVCGADTPSKNSATLVSKSTRVEATLKSVARTLRNKITSVETIANNINQYFWFTSSGTDTGAHITEVPQEEFTDPNSENYHAGYNTLFKSIGLAIRKGLTELATFSADTIRLGVTTALHVVISGATIQFKDGQTVLASFGATSRIGKSEEPHIDISNNEMEFLSVEGLGSRNSYFKVGVLWGETADVTGRAYYSLGERDVTAGIGDGSVVQGIGNRAVYRDQLVLGRYARKGYITDRGGWIDENDYTFTVDVSDILSDTGFTDKNIKVIGLFRSNPEWSVSNGVVTVSFQKDIPDITYTTDTEWEGYVQFYIYIGEYALQIGNGKSNEPSDAFAVTWDGNIETAIDTNAASGTEDNALYTALSNLSWTDAIVSKMLGFKNIMTKILTLLKTHDTKLGYASASLIQHTCTYVSNNYVTAENFSSLKLEQFKGTRIGILHFLLYITTALPSNTWVDIGSLPITPSSGINQYVPGSDSTHPPIYVAVTATGDNAGKIRLRVFDTSSLTAQGWYRAEIPVVLPYRTS